MKVRRKYFLLRAAFICLAACAVGGMCSQYGWLFNLCSHFKVQYLCLALLFCIGFAVARNWAWLVASVGLTLLNAWAIVPQPSNPITSSTGSAGLLRVMQMNVYVKNRDFNALDRCIRTANADVIGMEEFNDDIANGLSNLHTQQRYPFRVTVINDQSTSQLALWSKLPIRNQHIYGRAGHDPILVAELVAPTRELTVVLMHPRPPATPGLWNRQQRQFQDAERIVEGLGANLIVLGDLNTSPWAAVFRNFLDHTHLQDSRLGHGIAPTWPVFFPPAMIPLDYVLTGPGLAAQSFTIGPPTGSDHLPVIVDLQPTNNARQTNP